MSQIVTKCHPRVKEIYDLRGPFRYKKFEQPHYTLAQLEKRPIQMITTGEYYMGQWKSGTNTREGRGVMVKDGSLYEGFWRDNKEHGIG
jgi:hypothetical protein